MDEALYLRILNDLASIDYRGAITYCRYNEPLADRIILTRVRQARGALPGAFLYTHTNGDYLTAHFLDALRDAGLNQLKVQVYLGPNDRFSDAAMLKRMTRRLSDLGLPYAFTDMRPGTRYAASVDYPGMAVSFEGWNYDEHANDRAQSIEVKKTVHRESPCLVPFHDMYIDHDGTATPCCNIRSDEPSHASYLVGRVTADVSIFDVYAGRLLADWRRSLLPFGKKERPCNTCGFSLLDDTPRMREDIAVLSRQFGVSDSRAAEAIA